MRNQNSISFLTLTLLTWYLSFHAQVIAVQYIDANFSTLAPPYGIIIPTAAPTYGLPSAISSAGDFNDDGYEDFLVGISPTHIAFVVFGTAAGMPLFNFVTLVTPTQAIKIYTAASTGTTLGISAQGVGDVNGDGIDDIIVGDNSANLVYVVFGKSDVGDFNVGSFTADQGIKITGTAATDFGKIVGPGGDLNDDGINDMLIGAPTGSKAYVIFGNKDGLSDMIADSLTTAQGFKITGVASTNFGSAVSRAGDVNGDGVGDFMIGAEKSKDLGGTLTNAGMVAIFYGRNTSTLVTDLVVASVTSSQACLVYGYGATTVPLGKVNTLSPVGDINNDNIDDIAIGNPDFVNTGGIEGPQKNGRVLILYGKQGEVCSDPFNYNLTTSDQGFTIIGYGYFHQLGTCITTGDLNKDGYKDLIIGAIQASAPSGNPAGKVYVFFGTKEGFSNIDMKAGNDTTPRTLFYYGNKSTWFGKMLALAKDMNEDGINDLIVASGAAQELAILYGTTCNSAEVCSNTMHPICYASRGCICADYDKKIQGQSCVESCTDGYYLDTTNPFCNSCPDGCTTCADATTCQSCESTLFLQGTSCVTSCSQGYKEGEGKTCVVDGSSSSGGETGGGETTPGGGETGGGETTPGGGETGGGETTPGGGETGGGETTPGGGETGGGETTPGGGENGSGENPQAGGGDESENRPETVTSGSSKVGMIVGIVVGGVVLIGVGIAAFIYKGLIIAKFTKAGTAAKYATTNKPTIQVTDREEFMRLDTVRGDGQSPRSPHSPQSPDSPISGAHGDKAQFFSQMPQTQTLQTLQVLKVEVDP